MKHNLLNAIAQGEGKTLEFKRQLPKGEALAKTLIAFANTAGGQLVIGVDDQRQVIGIEEDEFELMDKIASMVHELCQPSILPNIYLETVQNKTLVVVQVFRGNQLPYFLKHQGRDNGTYLRLGAINRQASLVMIHELERQALNQSFDEQIAWELPLSSLDLSPLYQAFAQRGKPLTDSKLRSLKLIRHHEGHDYPTHGLMILLGLYEQVEIKCARFKGTTMTIFLDKKEYTGDVFSQLAQTEIFIKNHLHLKGEILGLQRTDTYEIPMPAIREALVNAIVHRDYSNSGRDIKVGIYDDVLNIVSPGGLPNGITLEDAMNGRSEIRNKVIARVFKELDFIEQWGSGIARMQTICQQANTSLPRFKETGDFFDIEFVRTLTPNQEEKLGDKLGDKLGETKASILVALSNHHKISITQLV